MQGGNEPRVATGSLRPRWDTLGIAENAIGSQRNFKAQQDTQLWFLVSVEKRVQTKPEKTWDKVTLQEAVTVGQAVWLSSPVFCIKVRFIASPCPYSTPCCMSGRLKST